VLIATFVSFIFQKSTENKHWGHRLNTENIAGITSTVLVVF